jgi:hypothetical protein
VRETTPVVEGSRVEESTRIVAPTVVVEEPRITTTSEEQPLETTVATEPRPTVTAEPQPEPFVATVLDTITRVDDTTLAVAPTIVASVPAEETTVSTTQTPAPETTTVVEESPVVESTRITAPTVIVEERPRETTIVAEERLRETAVVVTEPRPTVTAEPQPEPFVATVLDTITRVDDTTLTVSPTIVARAPVEETTVSTTQTPVPETVRETTPVTEESRIVAPTVTVEERPRETIVIEESRITAPTMTVEERPRETAVVEETRPTTTTTEERPIETTVATDPRPTVMAEERPTPAPEVREIPRETTAVAEEDRPTAGETTRGPGEGRRIEDLPPIDPEKYREIEVTERRRTFVEEIDREIKGKENGREEVVVAATDLTSRESEEEDTRPRCRDREYFKDHLDECGIMSEQTNDSRRNVPALRAVRDSRCTSGDAVLQSKSSIFDVANAKVLDFPAGFAAPKLKRPLVVESKESSLKQYILIPVKENDRLDALLVDPATGLVRIVRLGQFDDVHLLNDADGVANIIVLSNASGVQFASNVSSAIENEMKNATPLDQLKTQVAPDLADPNESLLKAIPLPAGGQVLSVHSYDKSLVLVRGDGKKAKDIVVLKSVFDAAPKIIPLNDMTDFMYRGGLLAPNGAQLEMAMITMKNENGAMTTFHADDLLADTVIFEKTEMVDMTQNNDKLKKIEGKNEVKKSGKSIKTKVADKDKFEQMLSDAMSAKKFSGVAVTHPFEDFGTVSNAIVLKDAGLGLVKLGGAGIIEKEDELIVPQENGAACITFAEAVAIDVDNAGGKDMAVLVENGDAASLIFYPNINQVQKFVSVTAEASPDGIQLNQQSETEENEVLKCHWEAFQKMPDGSLKDVSTQLSNPDVCNPIFKSTSSEAGKISLKTMNVLNLGAQWIVDQVMARAYAADSDSTEYVFRVTTIDPQGQKATADAIATSTSGGSAKNPVTVKVVNVEVLTQTQTETVATQAVDKGAQKPTSGGTSPTIANVGMTATTPLVAGGDPDGLKSSTVSSTTDSVVGARSLSVQGGFGCSLIRPMESASAIPMKVRGEVSESPGFFERIRSAVSRVLNTVIATVGDFFQSLGGKVRVPEAAGTKIVAEPVVMTASDVQRTMLASPSPVEQNAVAHSATLPSVTGLAPAPMSVPTPTQGPAPVLTPSVLNIRSTLAPSASASPVAPASVPASAREEMASPDSPDMSMPPHPSVGSRDVLNYKSVEGPPAVDSAPAASPASPPATAPAAVASRAPSEGSSSIPEPVNAPAAVQTDVTAQRSTSASASPSSAPASAPITAPVSSPVTPRPVIAEAAVRPAVDVAPAAPLAAELPATRPATIAVRPEANCNDISFVIANRSTCRCAMRDAGLGNILPLTDAPRGEAHAVSIEGGKVLLNPALFLRDALHCAVDPALPQPVSTPSFELPQPRLRGAERDLWVANVFVTPEGRVFGVAVDDAEGHKVRGIAIWDVGLTSANTMLNFEPFPEFLQLNEAVRGMGITTDATTGRTTIDITLITARGSQEPHRCDLSRDDVLTCSDNSAVAAPVPAAPVPEVAPPSPSPTTTRQ